VTLVEKKQDIATEEED